MKIGETEIPDAVFENVEKLFRRRVQFTASGIADVIEPQINGLTRGTRWVIAMAAARRFIQAEKRAGRVIPANGRKGSRYWRFSEGAQ